MTTIFSPDQLAALVATIPDELPTGHHTAIVGTVDQTGAQIIARFKFQDHLTLTGAWRHEWAGDDEVGARLLLSF